MITCKLRCSLYVYSQIVECNFGETCDLSYQNCRESGPCFLKEPSCVNGKFYLYTDWEELLTSFQYPSLSYEDSN